MIPLHRPSLYRFANRTLAFFLGAALPLTVSFLGAAEPATPRKRPEVVTIYYPHWHNYDHGTAWKGEGWTEWDEMKQAIPRFPGHHQPLEPTWGHFDESDPKWVEKEIDLAADHGIDVFLYDWYWYSGVRTMQEALEQGFLKAPNRNRMKFALMWANHDRRDQFWPEFGKDRTVWMPIRHSPRNLERVVDYCIEHYFQEPNYWRVDGGLFFSIFQPKEFVEQLGGPEKTRELLKKMDAKVKKAGLPSIHWNAMARNPKEVASFVEAGFSSTSRYNVNSAGKVRDDLTERYEDVMEAHRQHWEGMKTTALPDMPVVTTGWDVSPRARLDIPFPFPVEPNTGRHGYPYSHIVVGNTPERFEQLLQDLSEHWKNDPRPSPGILINAWNEWTEGCYLLPEKRYGKAYLEAVKRTFPR